MTLHTFGDSHTDSIVRANSENLNLQIVCKFTGPITMARFGLEKLNLLNIKNYKVNNGDIVCFSFGEIDCRSHLCKPQNFKIYKELINVLVYKYFEAIKINVDQYNNIKTMVFNIVPTIRRINTFSNPEFPHIGLDDERKLITLYMNSKLKEHCEKYNYIFFDVYEKYCDLDGFLNLNLKDSAIHIGNTIYINEFLKNIKFYE